MADGRPEILLDMGAHPDVTDSLGNTALHWACAFGNLKVMRTLVERGAAVEKQNRQGWMPVEYSFTVEAEEYFRGLAAGRGVRLLKREVVGGVAEMGVASRARASSGS